MSNVVFLDLLFEGIERLLVGAGKLDASVDCGLNNILKHSKSLEEVARWCRLSLLALGESFVQFIEVYNKRNEQLCKKGNVAI